MYFRRECITNVHFDFIVVFSFSSWYFLMTRTLFSCSQIFSFVIYCFRIAPNSYSCPPQLSSKSLALSSEVFIHLELILSGVWGRILTASFLLLRVARRTTHDYEVAPLCTVRVQCLLSQKTQFHFVRFVSGPSREGCLSFPPYYLPIAE